MKLLFVLISIHTVIYIPTLQWLKYFHTLKCNITLLYKKHAKMNIQANMSIIFSGVNSINDTSNKTANKSPKRTTIKKQQYSSENGATQEAKQLEFNLNNHLRSKYKSQEKVSFIAPPTNINSSSAIESLISKDIEKRKTNCNWNTMSACEKWLKVKTYYNHTDLEFNESLSKKLLLSGKLNVIYDKDKKEISKIIE